MAAMQFGLLSAHNTPDRFLPRIVREDRMTAQLAASNRVGYGTLGAEPFSQKPWSDPNAPMELLVVQTPARRRLGAFGRTTNASSVGADTDDAYRQFHVPEPHWLANALAALADVDDEIAEEELPQVGEATKIEAARIIKALARRAPAPTVYPTQDAEIALHFKAPGRTGTVVILLSDGGRADCHAYVGGASRRAHYNTSSDLPDAFVLDQLRRLTPPIQAAVSTPDASFSLSRAMLLQTI